jgi:hypothetical protein
MTSSSSSLTDLYYPSFGIATALHRRGNAFYIVFPRAYGMANGNKLVAQLNFPQPNDPPPDPPASEKRLNCRIWHREGPQNKCMMTFEEIMSIDPPAFKDSGLRRTLRIKNDEGKGENDVEERLVEVLLREDEFCQRCAWCGGWEYSYEGSTRHVKVKEAQSLYWCGVSILLNEVSKLRLTRYSIV